MADRRPGYRDVLPIRDLVTLEEVAEAKYYTATNAHALAHAKANAKFQEYLVPVTEAVGATLSDERSVEKRKWEARASSAYLERLTAMRDAAAHFYELELRWKAAEMTVSLFQTITNNRGGV